jgi:hypothetical protein
LDCPLSDRIIDDKIAFVVYFERLVTKIPSFPNAIIVCGIGERGDI